MLKQPVFKQRKSNPNSGILHRGGRAARVDIHNIVMLHDLASGVHQMLKDKLGGDLTWDGNMNVSAMVRYSLMFFHDSVVVKKNRLSKKMLKEWVEECQKQTPSEKATSIGINPETAVAIKEIYDWLKIQMDDERFMSIIKPMLLRWTHLSKESVCLLSLYYTLKINTPK